MKKIICTLIFLLLTNFSLAAMSGDSGDNKENLYKTAKKIRDVGDDREESIIDKARHLVNGYWKTHPQMRNTINLYLVGNFHEIVTNIR